MLSEQLALDLDARARRDRGLRLVRLAEGPICPWTAQANRAIAELARRGTPFTAEDLRELIGDPPRPGLLGAAFHAAARAELIECIGYQPSERPERRAGVVRVWRGTEWTQ